MSDANIDPSAQVSVTNRETQEKWAIDVHQDPAEIPLAELDPGHPSLFEHDKFEPYFERLRAEDPASPDAGKHVWSILVRHDLQRHHGD